jgi:hypothetical protein
MLFVVSASGPDARQLQELHFARANKLRVILVLLGDVGRKPRLPVDLREALRIDLRRDDDKAVQKLINAILRDRPSLDNHQTSGD